jgi:hypothetical protein
LKLPEIINTGCWKNKLQNHFAALKAIIDFEKQFQFKKILQDYIQILLYLQSFSRQCGELFCIGVVSIGCAGFYRCISLSKLLILLLIQRT